VTSQIGSLLGFSVPTVTIPFKLVGVSILKKKTMY
jgi:hypothetical protein